MQTLYEILKDLKPGERITFSHPDPHTIQVEARYFPPHREGCLQYARRIDQMALDFSYNVNILENEIKGCIREVRQAYEREEAIYRKNEQARQDQRAGIPWNPTGNIPETRNH